MGRSLTHSVAPVAVDLLAHVGTDSKTGWKNRCRASSACELMTDVAVAWWGPLSHHGANMCCKAGADIQPEGVIGVCSVLLKIISMSAVDACPHSGAK